MKQRILPIHPPIIERKCQFGTCSDDLAFVVNGVDLCFAHGREQLEIKRKKDPEATFVAKVVEQLELVK